jgi:hypothetical protein
MPLQKRTVNIFFVQDATTSPVYCLADAVMFKLDLVFLTSPHATYYLRLLLMFTIVSTDECTDGSPATGPGICCDMHLALK